MQHVFRVFKNRHVTPNFFVTLLALFVAWRVYFDVMLAWERAELSALKRAFPSVSPAAYGCSPAAAAQEYAATEALWGDRVFFRDVDNKADMADERGPGYITSLSKGAAGKRRFVALNVGANKGHFALRLLQLFPLAIVHSFEAFPGTLAVLAAAREETLPALRARWNLHGTAVGDADGSVTIFGSAGDELSHLGTARGTLMGEHAKTWAEVTVPITRLDTWLTTHAIFDVDFLQVDAEGQDGAVLEGLNWPAHRIPLVSFELGTTWMLPE